MGLPNFLVIGAQKAGTTWISKILEEHPQIFIPKIKEVNFFDKKSNYEKGIKWYEGHFPVDCDKIAIGEATPNYLWVGGIGERGHLNHIPELVKQHIPDARFIVTLRDPVDRAISAFFHHVRARRISPNSSLFEAGQKYGIIEMGFYYSQLKYWFDVFPENRFLILIYEKDIVESKNETVVKLYRFLNVKDDFHPTRLNTKYNIRWAGASLYLSYCFPMVSKLMDKPRIRGIVDSLPYFRIRIKPDTINRLSRIYVHENRKLERLIKRDLSFWK